MAIDFKELVDTVVVVMLENRSFDHMLGYLSLKTGANRSEIDGITSPRLKAYRNVSKTEVFLPFLSEDGPLDSDVPHGRNLVDMQMAFSQTTGTHTMTGFAEAYRVFTNTRIPPKKPAPLALMKDGAQVPTTDFFAENYTVCDRWFAPLPADTQPNRLMALSGITTVDETVGQKLKQPLVYEWLTNVGASWRVYRSGLPFCTLFPQMWNEMLDPQLFRSITFLAKDVQDNERKFPQVVFCEPSYLDSPVHAGFQPNDDHPPLPAGPGERFLREIYEALASNPARWARTVLLVTYDEHGGFFDHVPPLPIPTDPPAGVTYKPFTTTGPRVPGLVISPLVDARSVYSQALDHTSILQFLAERFGDGIYSAEVTARKVAGIHSVGDVLTRTDPRPVVKMPPDKGVALAMVPLAEPADKNRNQVAFEDAARELAKNPKALEAYPELAHLKAKHE